MAYQIDAEPMQVWRMGNPLPAALRVAIEDGAQFHAFNAGFERTLWNKVGARYGWPALPADRWMCSYARACAASLGGRLEEVAAALRTQVQKDKEGAQLMKLMCAPSHQTPAGPVWVWSPEQQTRLEQYCATDVETEMAISAVLPDLTATEKDVFWLDATINDRGVAVDSRLITAAMQMADEALARLNSRVYSLSGGEVMTVGANAAMTDWLAARGVDMPTMRKFDVEGALARELPADAREMLELRRAGAKTSTKKFISMRQFTARDGRMHNLLVYHGAGTGRWTGRGPQLQNLPRGTVERPEQYIDLVLRGDMRTLEWFGNPLDILSSMVRSAIVAPAGKVLIGSDYAQIEARMLAWIAGDVELLDAFKRGEDPYKLFAKDIYPGRPIGKLERQVAKSAVLGLGYQMGASNFIDYCAQNGVVISATFAEEVVAVYRERRHKIKQLWYSMEQTAVKAVRNPGRRFQVPAQAAVEFMAGPCRFGRDGLVMILPSGRRLWYYSPHFDDKNRLRALDMKKGVWYPYYIYGGLLTENLVQAAARDILANGMLNVERAGLPIVLSVHDEILVETVPQTRPEDVEQLMCQLPEWALGCPIKAEGWKGERYRK